MPVARQMPLTGGASLNTFSTRLVDPGEISRENVSRNQQLADILAAQAGQPQNIQHWTQGLAQLANAMNAQIYRQREKRGQEALQKQEAANLGQLLGMLPEQFRGAAAALPPEMTQNLVASTMANAIAPTQEPDRRFDEYDVLVPTADGNERRVTVEAMVVGDDIRVATPQGNFVPVREAFPNAISIEPAISRQVQTSNPSDFPGTPSQIGAQQTALNNQAAAVNAYVTQSERLLKTMMETPGANTLTASLANIGSRLLDEVKTASSVLGVEFEQGNDAFNTNNYEDMFNSLGLAGESPRVKNGFLSLAIQRAMASGLGTGRALSNEDIRQQLNTLGSNQSDPAIVRSIFEDSYRNLADQIRFKAQSDSRLRLPEIRQPNYVLSDLTPEEVAELERLRRQMGVN